MSDIIFEGNYLQLLKYDDADETELSEKEKRLAKDYQLQRALDLLKGLSIFEESFEE